MQLKWGIVGAGKISHDFASALKNLPRELHVVWSVASKDMERLELFASKFDIKNKYTSYEGIATDPDIEIVYVANLNPQHFSTCKLMLEHGKNVLCEKPMCMNFKDTEELFRIAKDKNLFLMEALWSRCFPVYEELQNVLRKNIIGDIYQLTANFGVLIDAPRVRKKDMGGSLVLDIGVYTVQLAMVAFNGLSPNSIAAVGHLNSDNVDESFSCIIKYDHGKMATLNHHSKVKFDNSAHLYGTKGFIKIHEPFWAPTKITINEEVLEFPLPENDNATYNFVNSAGLLYEAIEVYRCLRNDRKQSTLMTESDSLSLAKMTEDIRNKLGVKF